MFNKNSDQLVNMLYDFFKSKNIQWNKTIISKDKQKTAQPICANDKIVKNPTRYEFPLILNGCTKKDTYEIIISRKKLIINGWKIFQHIDPKDKSVFAEVETFGVVRDFSNEWEEFYLKQKNKNQDAEMTR